MLARGALTDGTPDALRFGIVLCCAMIAFLDGFDTQSIGPAGPLIVHALALPISTLGPVFSISQIGFLIGTLVFAPLGDRFGRGRVLAVTVALFAIASIGTSTVSSLIQLLGWRLVAGFGLGGATPNFVGLAADASPARIRARVVMLLWAAVPLGGMAGSFLAAAMIPVWGWQSILFVGGILPLFLLPVLWLLRSDVTLSATRTPGSRPPMFDLISGASILNTALLWLTSFTIWTMLIVTAFWTPPLMLIAGFSTSQSAQTLAFNNIGAVIGTLALGSLLGRLRPNQLLLATLPASSLLLFFFGRQAESGVPALVGLLMLSVAVGFFGSASGGAILGLSADIYPKPMRTTGIGWALGFGRIGSVVGPLAVAALVTAKLPVSGIYTVIGATATVGTALTAILSIRLRKQQRP